VSLSTNKNYLFELFNNPERSLKSFDPPYKM